MKEALLIILGWLFGLLSPTIVARIGRHYKKKDFKIALDSELKNLAIRLATGCYTIQKHLGIKDKDTLKWIKRIYEKYRAKCPESVLMAINKLLELSDDQFNALTQFYMAKDNIGLNLKSYSLPFLDSMTEYLSIFDTNFQRDIMEVRSQMDILNEDIENGMFFYRLTFDSSCMSTNAEIVRKNIKESYGHIDLLPKNCTG